MPVVIKGSNLILNRQLFRADGVTPIPIAALTSASVELRQDGVVKFTFSLGLESPLSAAEDGVSLNLDLDAATTAALAVGYLTERYTLEIADERYIDGDEIPKFDLVEVFIAA